MFVSSLCAESNYLL
jgi:hypothetical protein